MVFPRGPGSPYIRLVDDDRTGGRELPAEFQTVYGRWPLPDLRDRPYTYTNFVLSRDGRVSFAEPGKVSGGHISRYSPHDRWLMALLRARADAILLGATSLEHAPRHHWTPAAIFPDDAEAWAALREAEGRTPVPLHVIVTRSGAISARSTVFADPEVPVLVVSTAEGIDQARKQLVDGAHVEFLSMAEGISFPRLLAYLAETRGVRTVLSEAGPRVYGALIQSGAVDDEFVTLSPIVVGNSRDRPRPGLVEDVAFMPDAPPATRLLTVHRFGSYLFLHSAYR